MGEKDSSFRVAMYSHDTYGLGHLTRTLRLARAASEAVPGTDVLVLTGSAVAHRQVLPPAVDYVKLPSVVKLGPDHYGPRSWCMSPRRVRAIRASIIRETLAAFRPHLFLVDNVPVGMKGELRPALRYLRHRLPSTRICLNLRDVLDEPAAILRSWAEDGVFDILRHTYDAIHVFGSPDVYDAVTAYRLPADKTFNLGYIAPFADEYENGEPLPPAARGRARVLVTVGGGGDGEALLECVLDLQRALGGATPFQFHVVTGPLMAPDTRGAVQRKSLELDGVTVHEHVGHLPAWMAECDVVLSMAGYNTLCEVMTSACRSVVVPRVHPRREQEIRARALERRGLLTVVDPRELAPRVLMQALRDTLERGGPQVSRNRRPAMTGIDGFRQRVIDLLQPPVQTPEPARPRVEEVFDSVPMVHAPGSAPPFTAEVG